MKASELIRNLEALIAVHGDLEVEISVDSFSARPLAVACIRNGIPGEEISEKYFVIED